MKFELTQDQVAAATTWINDVARPEAIRVQRSQTRNPARNIVEEYWNEGVPYSEVISWKFSQSSGIGTSCRVILEAGSCKLEYDITDYSAW